MEHCHACGMPLAGEESGKAKNNLCQYCSDDKGNLVPRDQAIAGIAAWLKSWSPSASDEEFRRRAEAYMNAMPAWQ
jgi:hypothetical protein